MTKNKLFLSLAACALLTTGCVDQIMQWQESDKSITEADIPLQWAEVLANYKPIKEYAAEYAPSLAIGLGLGADLYISDPEYKAIADENFQMFTTGNAMKHSSVVKANGDLNFSTIDAFMALVPEGVEVYGHNFLWHTQQKQQYLKSLIAPTVKIEVPGGEKCENVVTNGGFENGTTGWMGFWGKYEYAVEGPGHDSANAIHFTISPECANMWDAQLFWSLESFLEPGTTYYYEFWAKGPDALAVQFIGQNASYGGIYKDNFTPGADWTLCSGEFTYEEGDTADIERIGLQFGGEPGSQIWIDDFKFGKKIEEGEQDPMINVVTNGSFDNGTEGWTGLWGKYSYAVVDEGYKGKGIEFTLSAECANMWDAQLFWPTDLEVGKTYAYSFWAKSDSGLAIQFIGQNESYAGIYKDSFTLSGEWVQCSGEFTVGESDPEALCRVGVQFGAADSEGAKVWIDEFKFGEKTEAPVQDPMIDIVTNGSFDNGTEGWTGLWGKYSYEVVDGGYKGKGIEFTLSAECANMWDAQLFWPTDLEVGKTYAYSFWAKSDSGLAIQFIGQNESYAGIYKDSFTLSGEWVQCSGEFTVGEGDPEALCRVGVQFGAADSEGAKVWIDEFKFGEKIAAPAAASHVQIKPAANITYIYKTAEEKKALLLEAMESWIKQMAEHLPTVKHWDVINEPITDGSNQWRGIGGNFMDGDSAPVEMDGLNLNWDSDHWYWGYYIGQEYAVKAFEYARRYCGDDAVLFVNDYNLEVSPGKLNALIEFVKYIEANGQKVDGIGTQMHVQVGNISREQVDEMFKTLAATGKIIRVTELDVAVGTASPTSDQLLSQAEVYKMIIESYKQNIPEAQQCGITLWTLSDNASEHEYWLKDDAPNLYDANYGRKIAYKYVCDAIAGKDVSEDFSGLDWKKQY